MEKDLSELKRRLAEINDLEGAMALLQWDQSTYMPEQGSEARGRQMATLSRLSHERATDVALGKLIDRLFAHIAAQSEDDAALIRESRRDFERASRIPSAFHEKMVRHFSSTYDAWAKARPANDFAGMVPFLETTLDLSRKYSEFFPGSSHVADPLIDHSDPGMTTSEIRKLFAKLREKLVPLVKRITEQPKPSDACLIQGYLESEQRLFGEELIRILGYDFTRGRQDRTHHPFMTKFSLGDVRITTRFKENDLSEGLFSTIHEAGHALYEQGIRREFEGTPLANGASSGVHESQSRFWENIVGRSRTFWTWCYPRLQAAFPKQLFSVPLDSFYRAINRVEPSLIRTDADEVTYNLHVMIRFDLEVAMLEGRLAVKDLAEAWRERYQQDLGVSSPDDRDGCLQDVHWHFGPIGGAFQGYTIGNILSAQLFDAALRAHPNVLSEIETGHFETLLNWLRTNVHQHGRKYLPPELIERATGGPLGIESYVNHLHRKYSELYKIG